MAGAQARPCSSFIMTGWSSEAAEQAGLRGPSSLAGEEGKTKLTGDGGLRKESGVPSRDFRRTRTGMDEVRAGDPFINVITFS